MQWTRLLFSLLALAVAAAAPLRAFAASTAAISPARSMLGVHYLSAVPAGTNIKISIALPYRHDRELDELIAAQGAPGSPFFRHFVSNEQFDAYFAPSQSDYARIVRVLRSEGFTIDGLFANRTIVDASAPAVVVNRVFGTNLRLVAQDGAGMRYASDRPAALPPQLSALRADVLGLDDLQTVRPVTSPVIGPPLTGPGGGAGPLETAQGYDMPVQHGFDGTGRATGVIMCGDFRDSDMRMFLKTFNIARTGPRTRRVEVNGGAPWYPPSNDPVNCSLEASLDVETIVGNTPGTALSMYLVPTKLTIKDIIDTLNRVVSDNVVDVLSSSLAGCESQTGQLGKMAERIGRQGAVKGITFASSTGDSGSNECGNDPGVAAPADAPTWMAIGGTALTTDAQGNYVSETGVRFGGGGYSVLFPEPRYQKHIANPLPNGRNEPDLAFSAVNVDVAYGANFIAVSGVSWSAPTYSALQTQIDQVVGSRLGHVNPAIYRLSKTHPSIFHDVTTGSNGNFNAGPGYDNVTGLGSVDGNALANALK